MSAIQLRQLFKRHVAQTSDAPLNIQINKAEGVFLYADDQTYIDCISGISVSNLGHAHPEVIKAIKDQAEKYSHLMVYGEIVQAPQVQLAAALTAQLPDSLSSVYYVNSGSEAIEGAMKLAKRFTGRPRILAQRNAYHGSTQGALGLMSDPYFTDAFRPLIPGIGFIEQNDYEAIHDIDETVAAVFVEPVMGEKGYVPCDESYLKALRKRCNETGTLLVFDEIQSGYGRTGHLFAFMKYGVVPDVLVLAKGFGAGMPLGAFIASQEIMKVLMNDPVLGHITTFGGHPVSCAASLAALNVLLNTDWMQKVHEKEVLFRKKLQHPKIKNISGTGLMLALEFDDKTYCRRVIDACVSDGLLIDWFLFAENKIRLSPPLVMEEPEITKVCGIIIENIEKAMQPI